MNTYSFVLGDNYLAYAIAAAIVGVIAGLAFTQKVEANTSSSPTELQVKAYKVVALTIFLFVIWRESDDLFHALVKASFPIGIYKIVRMFVSLAVLWRADISDEARQDVAVKNG